MDRAQLLAAIEAQSALRGVVADEIIDATIALLHHRLSELEQGEHRRRQVTVLFADVSGFTAMSEMMDAEHVTVVMNAVWERLDAVVVGYGGRIDKHIGDALMAVWGAEASSEDDPERAVRAGLDLQGALGEVCSERALHLAMRVGLNTGPVLLGAVGSTGEVTAMGDTVNVASRIEGAASRDSVLIAHSTYRHVRGLFDVRELAPVTVKGKSEPLTVYEVISAKQRSFWVPTRGVEGVETCMVGRRAELETICLAFETVVARSRPELVTVVGEAGLGKSRLLYEFGNWLELQSEMVFFLKGRALPHRRTSPLSLVRDVVANRFEILDSDTPAAVSAKILAAADGVLTVAQSTVFGAWLGFELEPSGTRRSGFEGEGIAIAGRTHLTEYIRRQAVLGPVVLLLEDVHWADGESLAVVEHLLAALSELPMLIVAAARPDFVDDRPDWGSSASDCRSVALAPLGVDHARSLVHEILQLVEGTPDQLIDLVCERSEGNPFFAEELVKMMIDEGVIVTGTPNGVWRIDSHLLSGKMVPATLTGVLQARLDALPATSREAVQRASVIGRIFWDDAVAALLDSAPDLGSAVDRELVESRRPSAFTGCDEFGFRHALLRDVAYETVLLSERPLLHARAAEWLEIAVGERRDEYLVDLAGHYEQAGEHRTAAVLYQSAAQLARSRGANQSAVELARAALSACATASDPPMFESLTCLSRALLILGDLDAADQVAREAVEMARSIGSEQCIVQALCLRAYVAEDQGDLVNSRQLLDEATAHVAEASDEVRADLYHGLGWSRYLGGDLEEASEWGLKGLELSEAGRDEQNQAAQHGLLGLVANRLGDFDTGREHNEAALALSQSMGDLAGELAAMSNLGVNWHERGLAEGDDTHLERAEACYRAAIGLADRIAAPAYRAQTLRNLGELEILRGQLTAARHHLEAGIVIAWRHNLMLIGVGILPHYAELLVREGEVRRGLDLFTLAARHPSCGEARYDTDLVLERLRAAGVTSATTLDEIVVVEPSTLDEVIDAVLLAAAAPAGRTERRSATTKP